MQKQVYAIIFYPMKLNYAENMPKVAIERAIAKGEPRALAQGMFSMTYEAMLPGGVALVM
jgi:transcriptional/translational regulatory protein YebC/TACO1